MLEEMLERDKKLVGTVNVPKPEGREYQVPSLPDKIVSAREISGYAVGAMGDPDPLYNNPDYGKYTRYGTMIAPPTFTGHVTGGPFLINPPNIPGLDMFHGGTIHDYSSNKPVRAGDEIHLVCKYLGYKEKKDPGKPYRLLPLRSQVLIYNQFNELVANQISSAMVTATYPGDIKDKTNTIFAGREKKPRYTREQLDAVHRFYDEELEGKHRRGADIRYWEDTNEGEEALVREGPLQVTDVVASVPYTGPVLGAFACGWAAVRQLLPGRAIVDPDTGEYQSGIAWHFSDTIARVVGLPRAHCMGIQNEAGLAHLVCNWMGDDGWVKRIEIQHRAVRLHGDMADIKGVVTKKYVEAGEHLVDIDLKMQNQDGLIISKGNATIRLISRED